MESFPLYLLLPLLGYFCGRFCARFAYVLPETLLNDNASNPVFLIFKIKECVPKQRLMEVVTTIFFSFSSMLQPSLPTLFFSLALFCILSCCFITDFDHQILPDILTFSLLWLGLIASIFHVNVTPKEAILGAALGYSIPWGLNVLYSQYRGVEGMYPGDSKLNAGIGACLGFNFLVLTLSLALLLLVTTAFFLAFSQKTQNRPNFLHLEMPYGCFASVATICVYVGST